ncbi:ABC transporter substrate-binding protein [Roseibium suaedae]|uniref:Iron complex transport system substrate-binding protein n=1 Tax=Roseibium suaedae TaxID=735517 RepID=A0A1M7MVP5_9HYPH|nr:ABC transporter substrate-binding protein [Roseibium suaedae]SHM95095.1 iron complex transport system substrate-binding protein [Roseibium suaedae]
MRFLVPCLAATLLSAAPALADGRTVTDDAGRTVTLPEHPAHIVVMHEPLLGIPLMDIGVGITGSFGRKDDGSFVIAVDFIDSVLGEGHPKPKGFGPVGQLDLERLRALEPDLILASELDAGKADQLATVAPVYLQNVGSAKVYGFDVEEDLAALVGREDAFAARKASYEKQLEALRANLPESADGKTYLAIFLTDQLNVVGNSTGLVQAVEDLGYKRLDVGAPSGAAPAGGGMMLMPLSAEEFGKLNPDVLILLNSYMGGGRDEAGTRASLSKIVPGWDKFMKPALEDRVLFVDPAKVITPSVASAEHMLTAMESWSARKR